MNPREFEVYVYEYYKQKGYIAQLTPSVNDWGVDVFAEKGGEKLAIQVKKYGGTARKINREAIMKLHGAKDYFKCTKAIIATDGVLVDDAIIVANKLGIEILHLNEISLEHQNDIIYQGVGLADNAEYGTTSLSEFEEIWEQFIVPLKGETLVRESGKTNIIDNVDWSGVLRTTSNGRKQSIGIEIFKWAIQRLVEEGQITREEINQNYQGRASSGIILILSQVPFFKYSSKPARLEYQRFEKNEGE